MRARTGVFSGSGTGPVDHFREYQSRSSLFRKTVTLQCKCSSGRVNTTSWEVGLQFPTTSTWKLLSTRETFSGAGLPFVMGVFMSAP